MRLAIPTEKSSAINIHLLISPDDPHHIEEIQQHLNKLIFKFNDKPFSCNKNEIIQLGTEIEPKLTSNEQRYKFGIENFRIDFSIFKSWYNESKWLKDNALIAVSAKQPDGTSSLNSQGGFAALRHNIEKIADIIFSASPSDIQFWLGNSKKTEEELIYEYSGLKPCLIGSDAHSTDSIFKSDAKHYCWIKAEPTFEGFRQILYEPKERVFIGEFPPELNRKNYLSNISVHDKDWFPNSNIPINKGLVSIIGPRGSGKTALLDIISAGLGAYENNDSSFLSKAGNLALPLNINVEVNKSRCAKIVFNMDSENKNNARYLSQHFVEQLCSVKGATDKLVIEIERFIFEKLESYVKQNANDFSELKNGILLSYDNNINRLINEIEECSNEITRINELKRTKEIKNKKISILNNEIQELKTKLPEIKKEEELAITSKQKLYEDNYQSINNELSVLKIKISKLKNALSKIENYNHELVEKGNEFILDMSDFDLTEEEKKLFFIAYSQSLINMLNKKLSTMQVLFNDKLGTENEPKEKTYLWYKKELETINTKLSNISKKGKEYSEIFNQINEKNKQIILLLNQLKEIDELDNETISKKRMNKYKNIFKVIQNKCKTLSELYAPLEKSINTDYDENILLSFYVKIDVDINSWVAEGNEIIDSRHNSNIKTDGGLLKIANNLLKEPWESGDPDKISEALGIFIQKYILSDIKEDLLSKGHTPYDLAQWIFSVNHIKTPYEVKYDGVSIEKLSPGTRGVVLMILFLIVDTNDKRPLLIDQPEDNLDPASVYEKLVPYFKKAKKNRQIIMVTHNPNLVVGTDSDQIIIANSKRTNANSLPKFNYFSGGLEDPKIINSVCNILEGGEAAFKKRQKRYSK